MEEDPTTQLLALLQSKTEELNTLQSQQNSSQSAVLSREIINLVDTAPPLNGLPKLARAKLLYYKGRALATKDTYDKSAEDNLTRSVKLDPTNGDAWNWMGEMLYLKGDYAQSKRCFEGALEHTGPNKEILRKLSMISRFVGNDEERKNNVANSVGLAKQALAIDIKDGNSWYVLANAHLTNFFINRPSSEELNRALKAYGQAENFLDAPNPDLCYNRGEAYKYLERYQEAIIEFQKAHELDPALNAQGQISQIMELVSLINQKIRTSCGIKKKTLSAMVKTMPITIKSKPFGENYSPAHLGLLEAGKNQSKILICKVLGTAASGPEATPAVFIACDSQGIFFCLSVYNINSQIHQLFTFESVLFIGDPLLSKVQLTFGEINIEYWNIKVVDPNSLLIDSKKIEGACSPGVVVNQAL
ncbi:TTC5_1 [Blepharisma stoltei]|uniref:Tetratricopeptide repeat protein 5 OB fold domain-containing protein n=1 Tax=Blepharisma stoltei TaxID=1481888 RepID=A0AAU9K5T5_9CILI|nr:unnamed protein product [Blepharisma stoltei]